MNTSKMNTSNLHAPHATRRWLMAALAGAAGALALAAYALGRGQQPGLESLEKKVARLEKLGEREPSVREVRTVMHERTVEKAAPEAPAAESEANPLAAAPESEEEAQYRAEVFAEAQRKTLSDAFANEGPDASWSHEASQLLRTTYEGEGIEAVVLQSECRSTMCRVTFRFEDARASLEQFERLKHQSPWPGHRQFTFDLATGEGTAYLSRENYELPSVDLASLEL